jgi:hypothetical protein
VIGAMAGVAATGYRAVYLLVYLPRHSGPTPAIRRDGP